MLSVSNKLLPIYI